MTGHYPASALPKLPRAPFALAASFVALALACSLSTPAVTQPVPQQEVTAGGGAAETAAPDGEPDGERVDRVIVRGQRVAPTREDVFEQARDLSRIDRSNLHERALPRFSARVCPDVIGLKPEFAEAMVARIRANATRLDVPLARSNCAANLIVAFVDDGRTILADFEREQPGRFELIATAEREELFGEAGPVRVWNNIEPLWADGLPLSRHRGRVEMPDRWGHLNRMFLATRTDIHSAVVLFDRDAVVGMTIIQLADYATMRGLSHTRPASGGEPMPTILSLFGTGGRDIPELTDFDLSYLHSLYFWRAETPAVNKLRRVGRRAMAADDETPGESIVCPAPCSPEEER